MYLNIEYRKMEIADLNQVMIIEDQCFISPWKYDDFVREINSNEFANLYVAELLISPNKKMIVGFYDYWVTFDSATISQIAVHKDFQRQGIASNMMEEILADCYAKKVSTITLEVRTHNEKACNLYKKYGFKEILVKPNYYTNGDDAYYMGREI